MAETLEASLRHPKKLQNDARPIPNKNKGLTAANTRTVAEINQQSPPNPIRIGLTRQKTWSAWPRVMGSNPIPALLLHILDLQWIF